MISRLRIMAAKGTAVSQSEHFPEVNQLVGRLCHRHFERANGLLSRIGVYRGQPPLLHALWECDGLPQATLSARLGVSPATVSKMVQRMERAGLVQRRDDPSDSRLSRVFLTQEGWAIRERVHGIWAELADIMLRGFSGDEVELLEALLTRLCKNLEHDGDGDLPSD